MKIEFINKKYVRLIKCTMIVKFTLPAEPLRTRGAAADQSGRSP